MEKHAINDVATYLQEVTKIIRRYDDEEWIFLYRGEEKEHLRPCIPGIFREEKIINNPFFEKNLFDTMRQNKLSGEKNYLENAIDAQHGEFVSRLLDVSYNCLIALYFAVTPYYHNNITVNDNYDGKVYIFAADNIYSPCSENINECYNAIVKRSEEWLSDNSIFSKNHKFIDNIKLNSRIIAQQGAFILFQGDDFECIPHYMYSELKIPKEAKLTIRRELKELFGIYTGSVYPEVVNLSNELCWKSKFINSEEFTMDSELDYVMENLNKELDYYVDYLLDIRDTEKNKYVDVCIWIEKLLYSYRIGMMELNKNSHSKIMKKYIIKFNYLLDYFEKELLEYNISDIDVRKFKMEDTNE